MQIKEFVKKVINYTSKISLGKVVMYKKQIINELGYDHKDLENRIFIGNISSDSIIKGRLTISIPGHVIDSISEIMLVSE